MTTRPDGGGHVEPHVEAGAAGTPDRRTVLRWLAAGVGAGAALGGCSPPSPPATTAPPTAPMTVARLHAERERPLLVAHRGAGDVVPEHTLEAYAAALAWGARAVEVSVCRTSDGVLVCNHDLTLDRTTDLTGPVSARTVAEVDAGRVDVPRLGPRWQGAGRPRIAHLDAALDLIGRRAVVCLEAKDDSAFPAVLEVIRRRGLSSQVYVKAHASSARIEQAHAAGLPVFGYLGSAPGVTPATIDALAARLTSPADVLVLPAYADGGVWLDDALVAHALATGVEVWVFPLHRRVDVDHFRDLGVPGAVVSSIGYLAGTARPEASPWPGDALRPGTMTRFPESERFGLDWAGDGVVSLGLQGEQHVVAIGGLVAPGTRPGRLELDLDVRLDTAPRDGAPGAPGVPGAPAVSVSLGADDDRYVDLRDTGGDAHHVVLSGDGSISVLRRPGADAEVVATATGPAPPVGSWLSLRLVVEGGRLTATLEGGGTVSADGVGLGAGCLHLGRPTPSGSVSFRGVTARFG